MARPALVIGLGGTGQWVLTYLKRELIEAYIPDRNNPGLLRENGLPKGVRLLSFDTVQERVTKKGHEEEIGGDVRQRKVGSVELENETEYIYYGSGIKPAVNIIWGGPQQPNYQAYAPQKWLKESYPTFNNLPNSVMVATDGAGAVRQVGRMALIEDLRKGNSKILGRIGQEIQAIVDELGPAGIQSATAEGANQNRRLEVIFVSSLAGGTGAGIFIDIALWCHHILDQRFPGATIFRAFLVSPFAFTEPGPNADTGKMARSFAAWRELSRFLTVGSQNQSGTVAYDGLDLKKQIGLKTRLFDVTYMIDPNREGSPLPAGHPEKNLYPSVAQAISAILDPEAGGLYSQDAINFASDLGNKDVHCAFGCYTIKVPIYYHWQKFTTRLESDTFEKLLVPTIDANGMANGVSGSANSEHNPADVGRAAVVNVLQKANLPYQGTTYANSKFWQTIADCIKNSWQKDEGKISLIATKFPSDGNWGTFGASGVLDALLSHKDGQTTLSEMDRNSENKKLSDIVPMSEEPLKDLADNPPVIERILTDHYSDTADNPGSLKKSLKKAGDIQFEMFANFIRAIVEQELNGTSSDPKIAKCGKIGWVKEFLTALRDGLVDYQEFCTKVLNRASAQDITGKTTNTANARYNNFRALAGKQAWITISHNNVHPKAWESERLYYTGVQALANLRRENLLFVQHRDTAARAQKFIDNALLDLDAWIDVFVKGGSHMVDNQPQTTESVYAQIKSESSDNEDDYKETQGEQSQMKFVGNVEYPEIQTETSANLAALLWKVRVTPNFSSLLFDIAWGDDLTNGRTKDGSYDLSEGVKKSHVVIHKQCGIPFIKLITENAPNTVFNELQRTFHDGTRFGADIQSKAEPYWRMTNGGKGPFAAVYGNPHSGLIALKTKGAAVQDQQAGVAGQQNGTKENEQAQDPFILTMLARLNLAAGVRYQVSERYDPFTFTYMRTDNVINSTDFNVYQECKNAYISQYLTGDAQGVRTNLEQYHIFPAEVHAAQYEREIAETLRQNFTLLSPEIVGLLDYKERIDDFFKAVALGVIRRQMVKDSAGRNGYAWVYQLEKGPVTWLGDLEMSTISDNNLNPYLYLINHIVYQSCDKRLELNQVNTINWDELHTFIWNAEMDHSAAPKYKAQYDVPADSKSRKEILEKAASALESKATDVIWPILVDFAIKGEKDLAHLCELNLRKANHDAVSPNDGHAVI
ncbi:MAG: tubulin-like doman-containing protein [Anaerolineaceae bacterium]